MAAALQEPERCWHCGGKCVETYDDCPVCGGLGYINVGTGPDTDAAGTSQRVAIMAKRYQSGMALWNSNDSTHER